jgi:hypothetical protein
MRPTARRARFAATSSCRGPSRPDRRPDRGPHRRLDPRPGHGREDPCACGSCRPFPCRVSPEAAVAAAQVVAVVAVVAEAEEAEEEVAAVAQVEVERVEVAAWAEAQVAVAVAAVPIRDRSRFPRRPSCPASGRRSRRAVPARERRAHPAPSAAGLRSSGLPSSVARGSASAEPLSPTAAAAAVEARPPRDSRRRATPARRARGSPRQRLRRRGA